MFGLLILSLHSVMSLGHALQCLDSKGNPVDWYFVYKAPQLAKHADHKFKTGQGFFYLDKENTSWTLSTATIAAKNTAITNTLLQVYANKTSMMYMFYNDQSPPMNISETVKGHTKGVVAFDQTSGFWMIHSAPEYPPRKANGYQWKLSASKFGQNFLCVSFPLAQLDVIGHQLYYYQPHVYDHYFPQDFVARFPILDAIIKGGPVKGPPWFNLTSVTSLRGQSFLSFAKSDNFGDDLYDALVAPKLQQDLMVESWMNGPGESLPSTCSLKYKVYDIDQVSLREDVKFNETIDHSKWAISKESPSYWTCASDINRKSTQFKRAGGCLCLKDQRVWTSFNNIIAHYQPCP
ncbi:plancitoxin-1-like [Biomphalaria glabrata]|uniref:Plancitoxin-1-like n=2 Tax=Biomphalaria glabrata TaxID=6526 RepID=A0A9W3BFG4_BIOGL|nr:plancitoxin-1-like [Biomphalaria glabrata]